MRPAHLRASSAKFLKFCSCCKRGMFPGHAQEQRSSPGGVVQHEGKVPLQLGHHAGAQLPVQLAYERWLLHRPQAFLATLVVTKCMCRCMTVFPRQRRVHLAKPRHQQQQAEKANSRAVCCARHRLGHPLMPQRRYLYGPTSAVFAWCSQETCKLAHHPRRAVLLLAQHSSPSF